MPQSPFQPSAPGKPRKTLHPLALLMLPRFRLWNVFHARSSNFPRALTPSLGNVHSIASEQPVEVRGDLFRLLPSFGAGLVTQSGGCDGSSHDRSSRRSRAKNGSLGSATDCAARELQTGSSSCTFWP